MLRHHQQIPMILGKRILFIYFFQFFHIFIWNVIIFVFSPTKGSKLEMLANVKSQMTGWLGSGVSVIPGLRGRQGGDGAEDTTGISGGIDNPAQDPTNESPIPGSPSKQKTDDDDNSR